MRDLETILAIGFAVIEIEHVIAERLAWPIGERHSVVAPDRVGHVPACRFQMALHADFELPVAGEACGIYDSPTDRFRRCLAGAGGAHMCSAGAMAALAINGRRLARLRAMAKQAVFRNRAAEIFLIGTIVAGTHRPVAAVFGIPTYRQFHELAVRRAM